MERFLEFWSHYNAAIIESLVALILVSAIYLAYRSFFGSKGTDSFDAAGAGGAAVNSAQIEKTLQKILDQQSSQKVRPDAAAGAAPTEIVQELGYLKKALDEKEKQIVVLQEKAAQAVKAAQAGSAGPSAQDIATAASAAAGLAEKERTDYETKIKDLEARLAEYEIISEDIADLSFFKEENVRLTKELEAARTAGSSGAIQNEALTTENVTEATVLEAAASEAVTDNVIDDSLMAEFAKAVEGQKSGSLEETPKSDENSKPPEDSENLNKKS